MSKILYVASTASHLRRFHEPYIEALRTRAEVICMANGEGVDYNIPFDKHFFSFQNLKNIGKIRKILKKEHFDAVILHTTLAAFLVRMAMLGMRQRPYVLNTVHGYLFGLNPRGLKDRVLLLCEKLVWRMTDEIAVMNAEDLEICKTHRLCRGKVYMTRGMGVSIQTGIPVQDDTLRATYTKDPSDFVCLFVGELSKRKNQAFLIDAMAALKREGMPIRLLLAGDGAEREALAAQIEQNGLADTVYLLGNREPILPYLSIADLYVSASVSEGLPFNVMEAMSCGLPILASATKGQTDLLADAPEALYPLNDQAQFCGALRRVYQSKHYGVGSRTYPNLEQYRLHAVFEETLAVFTNHLN